MHCEGVAEEVRRDDRTARPGLDDVLGALVVLDVHLLLQVVVDERALGDTAWHSLRISLSALLAGPTTAHDELVALLARAAGAALDRKSTRLNSSHLASSYAVFCLKDN